MLSPSAGEPLAAREGTSSIDGNSRPGLLLFLAARKRGCREENAGGRPLTHPLVSIIIPTHNRAALLREAVDSALSQTYPNVEVIVVDDGSTDDTGEVLSEYAGQVRAVYQDNRGRSAARNVGIQASGGRFLVFLDSDDLLMPAAIQSQVDCLIAHPDVGVVYGDGYIMDAQGLLHTLDPYVVRFPPREPEAFARSLLMRNHFVIHAGLIRRTALPLQPVFGESLTRFEDWDLWIRMCLAGTRFVYIDQKSAVYRRHAGNTDMADLTASRGPAAEIILHVVRNDLDRSLTGDIRRDVRLYHIDLLVEYGAWPDVLRVVRDVVCAGGHFSVGACQMLLLGRGSRPAGGPAWARALPVVLARRWIGRRQWQQLRAVRIRLAHARAQSAPPRTRSSL